MFLSDLISLPKKKKKSKDRFAPITWMGVPYYGGMGGGASDVDTGGMGDGGMGESIQEGDDWEPEEPTKDPKDGMRSVVIQPIGDRTWSLAYSAADTFWHLINKIFPNGTRYVERMPREKSQDAIKIFYDGKMDGKALKELGFKIRFLESEEPEVQDIRKIKNLKITKSYYIHNPGNALNGKEGHYKLRRFMSDADIGDLYIAKEGNEWRITLSFRKNKDEKRPDTLSARSSSEVAAHDPEQLKFLIARALKKNIESGKLVEAKVNDIREIKNVKISKDLYLTPRIVGSTPSKDTWDVFRFLDTDRVATIWMAGSSWPNLDKVAISLRHPKALAVDFIKLDKNNWYELEPILEWLKKTLEKHGELDAK